MKIAILGYGLQGRSAYDYWKDGNDITICDSNKDIELPKGIDSKLGEDYLSSLDVFDLIVRSPSVHPKDISRANNPDILNKVTTVTNEFFKACPSRNIVGVTGTKGKGTTATLIAKMLEATGKKVHLGGNIGTPPLDLLKGDIGQEDYVVLELANFQLIDLEHSPHIAVCLMVVPEHINWHGDMNEYVTAKSQLFRYQHSSDVAIYYAANKESEKIAGSGSGHKIPYYAAPGAYVEEDHIRIDGQVVCKVSEIKLLGKHNWQNVCAAVTAVWQVTKNVAAIRSTITSFKSLPFRIEFIRELNGVQYYNDSFASGPGASVAAFRAVSMPKVMILGGFDRGLDLSELVEALTQGKDELRVALLVGASARRLADTFDKKGLRNYAISKAKNMEEIVREASSLASPGDAVVLSPGFASFDMFKNFEQRGQKFNEAVKAL